MFILFQVVRFFCLKLEISITTEPIGFSYLGKLHMGPVMVLGYFILRFKSFKLFFYPLFDLSNAVMCILFVT